MPSKCDLLLCSSPSSGWILKNKKKHLIDFTEYCYSANLRRRPWHFKNVLSSFSSPVSCYISETLSGFVLSATLKMSSRIPTIVSEWATMQTMLIRRVSAEKPWTETRMLPVSGNKKTNIQNVKFHVCRSEVWVFTLQDVTPFLLQCGDKNNCRCIYMPRYAPVFFKFVVHKSCIKTFFLLGSHKD